MSENNVRILLVDNKVDAREWLAERLGREGFTVYTAGDGDESLRLVREAQGDYDVVLMDLVLDHSRDGIETMQEIRALYPEIETIIITGFGRAEDGVRAMKAGAYKYLTKPLNHDELLVYISHAVERRRLMSEVSRSKIFETFSALRMAVDLNLILDNIVGNLRDLFSLATCTVALLDADKTRLEVVAERGLGCKVVKWLKNLPEDVKQLWLSDEPLEITDLSCRADWQGALLRADLKSFTVFPLRGKDEPFGVITMGRTEPAIWTPDERRLLKGLVDQAAIAIENAQLHAEKEHWIRLLEKLDLASLDIADPKEARDILLKTIQGATELLQASGGAIYILAPTGERDHLEVKASYGTPCIPEGTVVAKDRGVVGEVLRTGGPVSKSNYSEWEGRQKQFDELSLTSVVGAPIVYGDTPVGVLALHNVAGGKEFTRAHEDVLVRFGKHAGGAIEKAQMLDEQRHADGLIQALVSELDSERLLDTIPEFLRDHYKYEHCALLLKDEVANELFIASAINYLPGVLRDKRIKVEAEGSVTSRVAARGKPLIVPDVGNGGLYIPGIEGGRSEAAVPLMVGSRVIGVLDVESTRLNAFNEHDERVLTRIAAAIAPHVNQAQRVRAVKRRMEQSDVLVDFTDAVIAAEGLDEKLAIVTRRLTEVSAADFCVALLLTRDGQRLRVRAAYREADDSQVGWRPELGSICSLMSTHYRPEITGGAGHKLLRRGEPSGERLLRGISEHIELQGELESALLVPLREGAKFLGLCVLGELRGRPHDAFTEQRIGAVVTLAERAASVINQARLLELEQDMRTTLERLNKIGSLVTATRDPDQVLNMIDRYSRELLHAELSTTFLVRRPGVLSLASNSGSPPGTAQIGLELEIRKGEKTGLTGHLAAVGQIFNEYGEKLAGHPAMKSKGPHPHIPSGFCSSLLAVPLKRVVDGKEELVGLIKVENKMDPRAGRVNNSAGFTEHDVLLLTTLASFALTAIQNAESFQLADTLQRVARTIDLSFFDYREVLQKVLAELRTLLPFDTASIQLRAGSDTLRVGACEWLNEEDKPSVLALEFPLIEKFPNEEVIRQMKPVLIPDVRATEYRHFWEEANIYCSGHIRTWLGVPLLYGDRAIGMLSIESNRPSFYAQAHVERAQAFADQVVPAIVNADLYKSAQGLLRLVEDITKHLEPETVLRKIAADAVDKEAFIGADIAIIYEYDVDHGRITGPPFYAGTLKEPGLINSPHNRDSIIYRCVDLDAPLLVNDVSNSVLAGPFTVREGVKSAAVFPLLVNERAVGLMFINYLTPHSFTSHEERVMKLFAKYAAIAIQNAREYEAVRRRMETAAAMARVGRLASIWAHDVHNPALSIRVNVDHLRSELADEPGLTDARRCEAQDVLKDIYAAAQGIAQVIPADLPVRHETEAFDLMQVLEEVGQKRRDELARAGVALRMELDDVPKVRGNSGWMAWICDGLINNALRFMPGGGTLTFSGTVLNRRLALDVTDTGPGVTQDVLEQLFVGKVEDPHSEGRGYNLLLIKNVLNDFEADISLPYKNELGENVFQLDLPLALDSEVSNNGA